MVATANTWRIPSHERWTLALVTTHLCFLPWALGTMHVWSQAVSLALAFGCMALALLPRRDCGESARRNESAPWRKLLRFPIFWMGLAILLYVVVQGLNPSWCYRANAKVWWLEPRAFIEWLPRGMCVPYAQSNPWRALVVLASAWLTVCAVWVGFTRRKTLRYLFVLLMVNGLLLSILGIAQQLTRTRLIFWNVPSRNPAFVASFIYPNHAGAYLNLIIAVAVALAWWLHDRAARSASHSGPAGLCMFAAMGLAVMVAFSLSRGSLIMLLAYVLLVSGAFLAHFFRQPGRGRNPVVMLSLLCLFAASFGVIVYSLGVGRIVRRFEPLLHATDFSAQNRAQARRAAMDMFVETEVWGCGAGCFRYRFPVYASRYPEIYNAVGGKRYFWEHAHCDWLEFPIEYGIIGSALLTAPLGWLVFALIRRRVWCDPTGSALSLGCVVTWAHGAVEFVFQNPAILITWATLGVCALRWLALERREEYR